MIHSDLKPANVFLTNWGRTKPLDFGIARVSRGPLLHAQSGPRALTPAYASCEMLEGKEADRRDDIYSFACVICEMLCGERPFGELNALEARDVGTQVPPLAVLSRAQNEALAKALAFDRASAGYGWFYLCKTRISMSPRGETGFLLVRGCHSTAVAVLGQFFEKKGTRLGYPQPWRLLLYASFFQLSAEPLG